MVFDRERQDTGLIENTSLLVWTTTPWTLTQQSVCGRASRVEYCVLRRRRDDGMLDRRVGIGQRRLPAKAGAKSDASNVGSMAASCSAMRYRASVRYYYDDAGRAEGNSNRAGRSTSYWRVVPADFVTIDSGTGIVHQCTSVWRSRFRRVAREAASASTAGQGPQLLCAVGPDGKFTAEAPEFAGRWVKDCDKDITRDLQAARIALSIRSSTCTSIRSAGGPIRIR